MKFKRFALVFAVGAVLPFLLFLVCTTGSAKKPPTAAPADDPVGVEISSVTAIGDSFALKWKTVGLSNLSLAGFLIYQEANDAGLEADAFKDPRVTIDNPAQYEDAAGSGTYTYYDRPGVSVGTYYYKIAAIGAKPLTGEKVFGNKSPTATIFVDIPAKGVLKIADGSPLTVESVVDVYLEPIDSFSTVKIDASTLAGIVEDRTTASPLANPIARVALKPGNGKKFVKATVALKVKPTDEYVLESFVDIREPIAKVGVRNQDMWKIDGLVGKHTNKMTIDFDIRLFGDRVIDSLYSDDKTFVPQCSVWLAVNGKNKMYMQDTIKDGWLETPAMPYTIDFTNPDKIYTYDLVTAMASGGKMAHTKKKSMKDRRAGAYYGGKDTTGFNLLVYTNPNSVFFLENSTSDQGLFLAGRKEFYLCAKFTGKIFNNQRFAMSFFNVNTRYFWDVYPPRVHFSEKLEGTPVEGDTVTQKFDVWMSTGPSVWDAARAKPTQLTMYIAQVDHKVIKKGTDATLADILNSRYMSFDYEFTTTDYMVRNVSFRDIDPLKPGAEWPTGHYVMAMVTADDKGNSGIAPADNAKKEIKQRWNPRKFYVKTGK